MTNRRFYCASRVLTASMALACGACATMDSDGERVGNPEAGNPYGVYVPPTVQQQAYAQSYSAPDASPTAPSSPYLSPIQAAQASASSTAAAPSAPPPPDPGLYAGDQGFSPWPSANGPS